MLISERTKAALAVAKSRGVRLGLNGQRLADRHKAAAATFAETLRHPVLNAVRNGAQTLQNVADRLNEEGYPTREGARWSPTGIRRLVSRLQLNE